jgi:hypothetical protein
VPEAGAPDCTHRVWFMAGVEAYEIAELSGLPMRRVLEMVDQARA